MARRLKNPRYQELLTDFIIEDVVKTAIDVFVKKGYDGSTMSEIAEKVNISKGSLYNFVGSKENLIYLISDYVEQKFAVIGRNLNSQTRLTSIEALCLYIGDYLEIINALQDAVISMSHIVVKLGKEGRRRMFTNVVKVQDDVEALLIEGIKTGEFRVENTKLAAISISNLLGGWASNRWQLSKMMTLEQYKEQMANMILKMVGADLSSTVLSSTVIQYGRR